MQLSEEINITSLSSDTIRHILSFLSTESEIYADNALLNTSRAMRVLVQTAKQSEKNLLMGDLLRRIDSRTFETRVLHDEMQLQIPDEEAQALVTMAHLSEDLQTNEHSPFRSAKNYIKKNPSHVAGMLLMTAYYILTKIYMEDSQTNNVLMAFAVLLIVIIEGKAEAAHRRAGGFGLTNNPDELVFESHENANRIQDYQDAKAVLEDKHSEIFQNNQRTVQDVHNVTSQIASVKEAKVLTALEGIEKFKGELNTLRESIQGQATFFAINNIRVRANEADEQIQACINELQELKMV